jgi:hypothetical protein
MEKIILLESATLAPYINGLLAFFVSLQPFGNYMLFQRAILMCNNDSTLGVRSPEVTSLFNYTTPIGPIFLLSVLVDRSRGFGFAGAEFLMLP